VIRAGARECRPHSRRRGNAWTIRKVPEGKERRVEEKGGDEREVLGGKRGRREMFSFNIVKVHLESSNIGRVEGRGKENNKGIQLNVKTFTYAGASIW